MKRLKYALYTLFTFCLFFLAVLPVSAKEQYTYTIRFFSGKQGSFGEEEVLVYDNLHYGDRVNFYQSAVTLNDNSKYYIRGIRESGKDNSESTQVSSFLVTGDRDYVIAYGILGDATSYTINYVDGNGNALAPSETYYGNVGDKPVVAYLYFDGWQPSAYNMTQTLKKNPAENVFNFVYTRITVPAAGQPTPAPVPAPETPAVETPQAPEAGGGIVVIPAAGAGAAADGGAGAGEAVNDGGEAEDGGAEIPEDNTPLGVPEEMEDLDEEETPTSNFLTIAAEARLLGIPLPVVLVLALGVVGVAWYFLILKKGKKKEAEEE